MAVSFHPYVFDPQRRLWVFPAAAQTDPEAFDTCLTNSNAVDLLLALGLQPDPVGGPMPLEQFANLVTAALRRHLGYRSPEIPPFCDQREGQMTVVTLGRREGYIEERLGELAILLQRSRAAGATHIGWG